MGKRVVAISRTTGAGGEAIGRIVSDQLAYRYVDEEIISSAASKAGVAPDLIADVEKRKGLVARFLSALPRAGVAAGSAGMLIPDTSSLGGSEDYRNLILEAIAEIAGQGEVVIVAHAASMALSGREDVLRVLVTASTGSRARRLRETGAVEGAEAATSVRRDDAARADYLKRFHSIDRELPTHYDLVVNTDELGIDRAAAIVVNGARL